MIHQEADRQRIPRRVRRGAYLLPSLITIGNILLGFYAIVLGLRQAGLFPRNLDPAELRSGFDIAALLVFTAAILDTLDGKIARALGTESEFGKEYDSLADVFTFGAVPAILTYLWGLSEWGRVGWLVPVFYLVCTATRLARFNVQHKIVDARYFVGLPTPAAAGAVCSILFFAPNSEWRTWVQLLALIATMLIGALMVSTFRYRSLKGLDLRKRWSYRAFVPIAAVILVIAFEPRATFLAITWLYTASGPLVYLWSKLRHRGSRDGDGTLPPPPSDSGLSDLEVSR